jgi:type II secretory pathway pseudopilin PulG
MKNERGVGLLEVVIAIGLLGILLAGFIPAMMGITRSNISVDDRATAKNLAERQMEYIKGQPYLTNYTTDNYSADYPGLVVDPVEVTATGDVRDSNIQAVTLVVRRGVNEIYRLTGYRVK